MIIRFFRLDYFLASWSCKKPVEKPKLTKKQKEKENLKKLDSNWDRYDLPDDDSETFIGRTIDDFESR